MDMSGNRRDARATGETHAKSVTGRGHADATGERRLTINVIREPAVVPMSPRMREICWDFGIPPRETPTVIAENLQLTLKPGTLAVVTGPSGAGKSSVLHAVADKLGDVTWVGGGLFPVDRAIVDCIAPRRPLGEALEILTACGLGEPRLWVRRFSDLSDGEQFRAALARAIGQTVTPGASRPILCDEFTTLLHRRLARSLAHNLRKLVTRAGLIFVAASTHDDILRELRPDVVIRLASGQVSVHQEAPHRGAISLQRRAVIERGGVRDYASFAPLHYRHRDGLGFVDKVFVLRESRAGDALGILVFAMAPAELAPRNRATRGRFIRNFRRLNHDMRILRRLVMHPDVRGCGLGHWFVRQTLPRVGVRFIECLASMGAVNPVFEKAGMTRVGRCPLPRGRIRLLERMAKHHVDPFAADFHRHIARSPRVRTLVERTILQWVTATTAGHKYRPERRDPEELSRAFRQLIGSPPMYYLWDREGEFPLAESIDAGEKPPLTAVRDSDDGPPIIGVRNSDWAAHGSPAARIRDHHPDEPSTRRRSTDCFETRESNRRRPRGGRSRHDPGGCN